MLEFLDTLRPYNGGIYSLASLVFMLAIYCKDDPLTLMEKGFETGWLREEIDGIRVMLPKENVE